MNKKIYIPSLIFLTITTIVFGFYTFSDRKSLSPTVCTVRDREPYKLIRPRLFCDSSKTELPNWEVQVKDAAQDAESYGVYLYDFGKDQWTGINEDTDFQGASLYKVPLMMAYLDRIQASPTAAEQKFERKSEADANSTQPYKPAKVMPLNEPQNAEQILDYMIAYSDNNASNILSGYIGESDYRKTFNAFKLDLNLADPSITPREYSRFFKGLYTASFVNWELSERALEILTKVDFKKGLVAGVPNSVKVAHKFGTPDKQNGLAQLHDCGIIYANNPYLLCVMTKGKDIEKLANIIKRISEITYSEIGSWYEIIWLA